MELSTWELVARMLLASVCGIVIGIKRNARAKEAGMRTHCIVACASALMMIISKYGFFDLLTSAHELASDMRLDPSRMAQGIVTGVGFLGAGLIYFQRGTIKGLTTAAGVWAVSGIGMAIGSGLYVIGMSATILVLLFQITLHTKSIFASKYKTKTIKIHGVTEERFQKTAEDKFAELGIIILDVSASRTDLGIDYSFCIEVPKTLYEEDLINVFPYRSSIDFTK